MRNQLIIMVCVVLSIFLSSCKNNDPICIGFSNELSGSNSALGVEAMYGATMAIDKINESGGVNGRMIELIIRDDKGDVETAIEVDNELKEIGCNVIIGHGTSKMASATIENANKNDILLISPTISTNTVEGIDDNFIRIMPSNTEQGTSLANFVNTHSPGATLVVYEVQNLAYTENVALSFVETYTLIESDFSTENIISYDNDIELEFQNVISEINSAKYSNVVLIGSSHEVSLIIQNLNENSVKVYIPVWPSTIDLFNLAGPNIENTHAMNYYDLNSKNNEFIQLEEEFYERFGIDMSFSAMFSYETVFLLNEVFLNIDDYTATNIKQEVINIGIFDGIIEDYIVDEYGDTTREVYFYHLRNEEFIEIE